ncbi:MAG: hypothetical protein HDR14_16400 [Lachnospiraceae bacterium]|nr:hypothetical protein [Lachnospiraceae bacterium]
MEKKKYYVRMAAALLLLIVGVVFALSVPSVAANDAVKTIEPRFESSGDAKYINKSDYYCLDMEKTGLLESGDAIMNSIANMLFTFIKWLGKVTVMLFYYCMDFDMSAMFKDQINGIQSALNSGIFKPLFLLGFCGSAVIMLRKMVRRDLMGAYGQVLKVVAIVVLSILVVQESSTVLTKTTEITKSISTQALMGMQGGGKVDISDYAAQSAGALWMNLIHQPWVFIEFSGENPGEETIEKLLGFVDGTYEPGGKDRKNLVEKYEGNAFDHERGAEKIGFMFTYLIPFVIKCVIYILMALLTLFFQLIAIFYTFLAPVVLILIMVPGYERLLTEWLRKVLESQLSILIMSFLMGLLLKMDALLYETCAGDWGWLVVMIVETVVAVLALVKRNELLGVMSKLQKGVSQPGYARAMLRNGTDGYMALDKVRNAGRAAGQAAKLTAEIGREAAGMAGRAMTRVSVMEVETGKQENEKEVVERPVMALAARGTTETAPSKAGNRAVGAQEPQIAPERGGKAFLYERGAIFQFEPSGGHTGPGGGTGATVQRPSMAAFYERAAVFQFETAAGGYGENFDEREVSVQRPREVPMQEQMKAPEKATQGTKKKAGGKGAAVQTEVRAAEGRTAQHRETASSRIKERQKAQRPVQRPQSSVQKSSKVR